MENAAVQQGHAARSVATVSAAPLPAGGQLRRSRVDDELGEEAAAGPRGRQHHLAPARAGYRDGGAYGEEGYIYQAMAPPKSFDDKYAVLGSWVIGHEEGNAAGGMGIRESDTPIIANPSQFVPHLFD